MRELDFVTIIFGFLGGLGLFLYGMKLMSEGLQKSAGESLKRIIDKVTSNRLLGASIGMLITLIIQSSSATTVMVVGFVNAKLMNLVQALSIVLGANIGTTITGQLIAFNITKYALPAIFIGAVLTLFSKSLKKRSYGEVVLGFGLLFFGLTTMKHSFIPLKESEDFVQLFIYFSTNPVAAAGAGALLTMIVQSSSATMGIVMAMATTGILDFQAAAALVLGQNMGTTITANLAALSASRNAKRAAFGHFLFNFFGVTYMLILLKLFLYLADSVTPGAVDFIAADGTKPYIAAHIANFHTMFNVLNLIIFLPVIHHLAKICEKVIKSEDRRKNERLLKLDRNMVKTPAVAIAQSKKELEKISAIPLEMLDILNTSFKGGKAGLKDIKPLEMKLNQYNTEFNVFMTLLTQENISEGTSKSINELSHVMHNIEKMGNYIQNIARFRKKAIRKGITFEKEAKDEISEMLDIATNFTKQIINSYNKHNNECEFDLADEEILDDMRKKFTNNHMKRLSKGKVEASSGTVFVDIINHLEKIGDHAYAIAQVIECEETKTA